MANNTVTSLLKRIDKALAKLEPIAKLWVLVLEIGQEIPDETYWQIRSQDTVVIRQIPIGYFGTSEGRAS